MYLLIVNLLLGSIKFIPVVPYKSLYRSEKWLNCEHISYQFEQNGYMRNIEIMITTVLTQFHEIIFVLQIYEWHAMINIIRAQSSKSIESFLYDYNTE